MMETFSAGQFDIAVIGAGHAGIEAALAAARLGLETIVFTINLDAVGNMPCNPAIGGTGKGHLVRELDALGGEMAKAADECCIQYRLLNLRKGPAVWSLRAQADRRKYQERMKRTLERQAHLTVRQGQVVEVRTDRGAVSQVVLATGAVYDVRAAVLATGTYLKGRTIIGNCVEDSGPDGLHAAGPLTDSLLKLGLPLRRFKTGTPPRVNARTVDFDEMEVQPGDELPVPFSYSTKNPPYNQAVCWLTWTTEETKRIVQENLDRAPMYSGLIEGIGPRYCPSIETKVVRFADKPRHQLFIEPCGLDTEEMYLQGASSSLPEDVQNAFYRSIKGFEHIEILRPAYAIEYDCVDPTSLEATLESKVVRGLYGAGQFNGTSGYEEAAAQGLVAGINAALAVDAGFLSPFDVTHAAVNEVQGREGLGYIQTRWEEDTLNNRGIYKDSKWPGLYDRLETWADGNSYLELPVLKYLFVPGSYLWLYLALAAILVIVDRKRYCLPLAVIAGYYGTMLLGPTVQMRYVYPVMLALPYLVALMCGTGRKTENEKTETDQR